MDKNMLALNKDQMLSYLHLTRMNGGIHVHDKASTQQIATLKWHEKHQPQMGGAMNEMNVLKPQTTVQQALELECTLPTFISNHKKQHDTLIIYW
jgi:hypothetical protein